MAPLTSAYIDGPSSARPLLYRCRFDLAGGGGGVGSFFIGTSFVWGCWFPTTITVSGKSPVDSFYFQSCGFGNDLSLGGNALVGSNVVIRDSVFVRYQMLPQPGAFIIAGDIGSFDIAGYALSITAVNGAAPHQTGNFFGIGAAQAGILIDSPGSTYLYDAIPPIVSTGSLVFEMRITGAGVLYTALPYRDAVNDVNVMTQVP